ncbi:ABC transporter ATP-binding protein [Candidatus Woesearchaeota archaeon]|jgi:putative ABC transport system ATP-binding protein|nr:ABC transporter ATP-binding protein [Candidatus Woesearchaeota archaeon]MBT6519481.1 ABC transporter ATP-binding protein [Candidatus Woesearchaeota archaeon]MBT7368229.1 ABC transporter ATP-binding protein [Candidatus Woesearchaeota archaeon]
MKSSKKSKSNNIAIKLTNVWKIYKMGEVEVPALRGLSLEIKKGEFVSIMGPSGSGKSTSMNLVGCLDIPTKGQVYLSHKNIASMTESNLAQIRGKKIGFIFQQFNLINTLSALENVTLPMIFQKVPQINRDHRATKLLKMVKLGHRIYHRPSEMSGGEQQRVAIARALANDPDIILADEPTGNLDSKTGQEVMKILTDLNRLEGKTIIIVTHDEEVGRCADRMAILKDGQILEIQNLKNKHKKCGIGKKQTKQQTTKLIKKKEIKKQSNKK